MGDDGRLDAAELDAILGTGPVVTPVPERSGTTTPGQTSGDLLVGGRDRPTWTARARAATGGRRAALIAVGIAVLAAGVGGWRYQSTRPPPLDPTIAAHVTIREGPDTGSGLSVTGSTVFAKLALVGLDPTQKLTALALLGPGLTDPTVGLPSQDGLNRLNVDTSNTLNCAAFGDLAQAPRLLLRVARTDPWGRVVEQDLPVTWDGPSDSYTELQQLNQSCLSERAGSLHLRSVTYDPGSPTPLRLTLLNPTDVTLQVTAAQPAIGQGTLLRTPGQVGTTLPASAVTEVRLAAQVDSCLPPLPQQSDLDTASFSSPDGTPGQLLLEVGLPATNLSHFDTSGSAVFALATPQRRALLAALRAPCQGAPALTTRVSAVRPSAAPGVLSLRLTVTASRGRVSLGAARDGLLEWDGPGTATASGTSGTGRTVSTTLTWEVQECDYALTGPPPTFAVQVRTDGRDFPYRIPLDERALLHAVATTCGVKLNP